MAIPFHVSYESDNETYIIIHTDKGRFKYPFMPYFYAAPDDLIQKIKIENEGELITVVKTENIKKILLGREIDVVKVYTKKPSHVPFLSKALRMAGIEVFEYDIPFVRRFFIDTGFKLLYEYDFKTEDDLIKGFTKKDPAAPNLMAIDIETYAPTRRIDFDNPILMIALYGKVKKVFTYKKIKGCECAVDEKDMLQRALEELKQADIITGYNSDKFDLLYIIERCRRLGIECPFRVRRSEVMIPNKVHLDLYAFARRALSQVLRSDSLSLHAVASELINEGKDDIDISKLYTAWDTDSDELESYASYNLRDAEITYKLALKLISSILEFSSLCSITLNDACRSSFSRLVEGFIFTRAKEFNQIAPNKPNEQAIRKRKGVQFEGAFVYQPKPGFYENIAIYDFRSLYPTIITAHNIDPESLNCACCSNKVPGFSYGFCEKKGFLATILEEIIRTRSKIKKDPSMTARTGALKLLSNSFYGYYGFAGARWYCFECGQAVAAYARHYIKMVIEKAEQHGLNVIYSDTDSIFILLGDKTEKQAEAFVKEINSTLPGLMELDFEGIYDSVLFVGVKSGSGGAKKRYALCKDAELKVKGFETVRSNVSPITKRLQREVLEKILIKRDVSGAFAHVRSVIKRLREGHIDMKDLTIRTYLSKNPDSYLNITPAVKAARLMEKKGFKIGAKMQVHYVVTKGSGNIRDRIELPEDASDYDPEYYVNNQIIPAVEKIFEVFGYDVNALDGKPIQNTLGGYFG